ncbi:Spy/CpxP family protein refolding chaperone [Microcoleus sp. LEGE 07076]|uniref:Spy/CpxP family protein refolding chaperone n=1 Tax=Microcoleus sp. LEGE 07076 TaxID=915322 RepID=UPI0018823027|nr:Spy/CpxP family protein refolding chaperone [Microcoleus sp. LEGE 07076]MBE9185722.1 Spy/CpxP family protein refolding chaperone [Microcoleus sp. LEGE 07076]
MSMRRISTLVLLMLTLGSATAAIAVPNPLPAETIAQNQRPNRAGGKEGGMFEKLNLSADQKQKMQAVRDRYKDQISQRMQAVRQARQELQTMMSGTATASQIRDKNTQITALKKQLDDVRLESTLAMREILTPAQRTQLAELMKQRREAAKNRMQNGSKPQ